MNNKEDSIYELIVDNCLDFLALTEAWCNENSTVSLGQITPPGYSVIHTHRPTRGGGVALIFRDTYKAKRVKTGKYTNFENQTVSLSLGTNYLHVTIIYIPSGIFSSELNEQISDLLSKLLSLTGQHVILGDFNFRINDPTDTHAAKFKALTEQFNLIKHVSIPTHDAGNTLDLVLTRDDLSVSSIFTDHSNLCFISKLVERVVCVQLVEHLKTNNLYEIFQSAYRQLHSTETALLRVQNDLLQAVDNEGGTILVLLDLSAAFDTIDHQKLLNLLNQSFGIRGVALKWFELYLKDRTQTVQIGSCTSTPVTLKYGVPYGSALGPILFTMYTTPLGNIIRKHGLNFHLYADDTQLYISFQPGVSVSKETAISCLEACIEDIKIWMTNNHLKLNDDKTELIVITTHSNTSQNQHIGINIGDSLITPSSEPPRNLGVLFDSTCSLNDHVSKICKSINYNL